jgi:GNAT superfamily N-acetyltransferase
MATLYSIRLARPDELSRLPAIEDAACALFLQEEDTAQLPLYLTPPGKFAEAQRRDLLWVAVNAEDTPIGFALVELMDDAAHLEEVDVLPEYGRRGIGAALVQTVCAWAAMQQLPVTLTTFRDIPWNAPFYARLGFHELTECELTPALQARVVEEAAHGLPTEMRVVMRYEVKDSQ